MPSKLLRARTAAVAGLTMLSMGGVAAAATGLGPASGEHAATQAASRTRGGEGVHALGDAATATTDHDPRAATATKGAGSDKPSDHAGGPGKSEAAKHGLCQAWLAGQGDVHGRRSDAPTFEALAAAAGGADRVPAWCQAQSGASDVHGRRPAATSGGASSGQREDPGRGRGQGGPPTTS